MISDLNLPSSTLLRSALTRARTAYRPSTMNAHHLHIRTYLAFVVFMDLPVELHVHSILAFLEYLHTNSISYKVLLNYISSLKRAALKYNWHPEVLSHRLVLDYIRSISINSTFTPTPRGIFDISTLALISRTCVILDDPILFRAIFLLAFFGFLRMSNIAPHSKFKFDSSRHFLRQDVIFADPGAHILLKWTKTLQERSAHHFVQIPALSNSYLCPVKAIQQLLASRPLPADSPLFVHMSPPFYPVIDTTIRDSLRKILDHLGIPSTGHGFHTFRRSGATLAFDNNVQLQHIMAHGLWRSSAVWTYLQNASLAPSIIPSTFSAIIPSHI